MAIESGKNGRRVQYEDKDYPTRPLHEVISGVRGVNMLLIHEQDVDMIERFLKGIDSMLSESTPKHELSHILYRLELARNGYTERKVKADVTTQPK